MHKMKLGICPNIDGFFGRIASHAQILASSILQIAIRLPADIGMLEQYALLIKARDQTAFDALINIISNAIDEPGPTIPTRYILTATIAVE